MDAIITMLEEERKSSLETDIRPVKQISNIEHASCHCLQKYANILCQLHAIEKRQCPIRVDTFLACTNHVLGAISQRGDCSDCQFDVRVSTQLVMIFETILTWARSYFSCLTPTKPDLTTVNIGRHKLTPEENDVVMMALLMRAVAQTGAALKTLIAQVEHVAGMTMSTCWKKPHLWGQAAHYQDDDLTNVRLQTERLVDRGNALVAKLTAEGWSMEEA